MRMERKRLMATRALSKGTRSWEAVQDLEETPGQ
jgi:hypothetical protein